MAANDDPFAVLGSFGDFLGGLARSVVPQDTPEGQMLVAQAQLSDLRKQRDALLLEIGREAYERDPSAWTQDSRLALIAQNIAAAEATVASANAAKGRCPGCGHKNPDEVSFCQECGTSLAEAAPVRCACGNDIAPGVRFCGGCGAPRES
ncbi:MAG: zinc-ribbon domain-containing protein [Micrococcales bacterium]|nr:zinc-ribbon domain-containing protein [Micrococcales bacterium]